MNKYKSNSERFTTFENWPLDFLSPQKMAKCGFFYIRREDIVKCAYCNVEIGDWQVEDDPWSVHQKHSPSCSYVKDNCINETFAIVNLDGIINLGGTTLIKKLSIVSNKGVETTWDLDDSDVCGIWANTVPIEIIKNKTENCRWVLGAGREVCWYLERILQRSVYDIGIFGVPKVGYSLSVSF